MKLTSLPPNEESDGNGSDSDALLWAFLIIVSVILAVAMMGGG